MTPITIVLIIVGFLAIITLIFLIKPLFSPQKIVKIQEQYKQGRYKSVIKMCLQVLGKDPGNNLVRYYLGLAYLKNDEERLALVELKKVNIAGNFTSTTFEIDLRKILAKLYSNSNYPKEALQEYILLTKLQPEMDQWYYESACLFVQFNKVENAINYFQKALKKNPQNSNTYFQIGKIYFKFNNFDTAEENFNLSIKNNFDGYEPYFYLGQIFKERTEFELAITAFEKSQQDPKLRIKSIIEIGLCYYFIKNYDLAISEFEGIISIANVKEQDIYYARYYLALCYEQKRLLDKAMLQWEKLFSTHPTFKDVTEKIKQYKKLKNDDKMKDYLTCGTYEFMEICKSLTKNMDIYIRDILEIENGCQILGYYNDNNMHGNMKKNIIIFFLRLQRMVKEDEIRTFYGILRETNSRKLFVITNTGFTESSLNFIEGRPIELFKEEKLQAMLKELKA